MKESFSIKFYLNPAKVKGDKQQIYLRIIVDREKVEMATSLFVDPKVWNGEAGTTSKASAINDELSDNIDDLQNDNSGFVVLHNTAYNTSDAANFLWGQAMKILGFNESTAVGAAHYNNATNEDTPGIWDAEADQRALKAGFRYETKK